MIPRAAGSYMPVAAPPIRRDRKNAGALVSQTGMTIATARITSAASIIGRRAPPVGQVAEDRLRDQLGQRPGRDDQPQEGGVDPVADEVERQDREERPEADEHRELGHEDRQERRPAVEPRPARAVEAGDGV